MAYKYLDQLGLSTLWDRIKNYISSLGYTTNKGTVGGSGTSGYLAKWTGTTAVGNGPQLGNSTVTFLRNDGQWGTPVGTTYSTATTGAAGLMSADDKKKLNSVASSATYNLAFKTIKVGTTDLVADTVNDTLTITAGNNITLTPTVSSDSFTIAATNTTYGVATTAANGLMSSVDKAKLDELQSYWQYNSTNDTIELIFPS